MQLKLLELHWENSQCSIMLDLFYVYVLVNLDLKIQQLAGEIPIHWHKYMSQDF